MTEREGREKKKGGGGLWRVLMPVSFLENSVGILLIGLVALIDLCRSISWALYKPNLSH